MCKSCKKGCTYNQCSCYREKRLCSSACGCTGCKNQPVTVTATVTDVPVVVVDDFTIVSWNLCHFTAFSTPGVELPPLGDPDIIICQELPLVVERNLRIDRILKCLNNDYEHAAEGEHLFLWKKKTVRTKPHVDKIRSLITDGVRRPIATMLFYIGTYRIVLSSLHLKSGGGAETLSNFHAVLDQYPIKAQLYYSRTEQHTIHILAGDFNLNPHKCRNEWDPESWCVLGNEFTQTSVGGRGYDFFMIFKDYSTLLESVGLCQRELVQPQLKNTAIKQKGITDHHPIQLQVYSYSNHVVLLHEEKSNRGETDGEGSIT